MSVAYVSPHFGHPVRASGFQWTCAACGWKSPVMAYRIGADAQADAHECEPEHEAAK